MDGFELKSVQRKTAAAGKTCRDRCQLSKPRCRSGQDFSVSSSTLSAGNPASSSAALAASTLNSPGFTDTVAVNSFASISTFATPGSDASASFTADRHPPQVMVGHENLTRSALSEIESVETTTYSGDVATVSAAGVPGGVVDTPSPLFEQPRATPSSRTVICFFIGSVPR